MSSCSVYGLTDGNALSSENDLTNPISEYASLKLLAEAALQELAGPRFLPTILRLSTVYGLSFRPRFDLMVNTIVAKAYIDKKIVIRGADCWRPFIHVDDVASVVIDMLSAEGGQVYNVGCRHQNHTIGEIGRIVYENFPQASFLIERQPDEDRRSYKVDFTKLQNKINYSPRHSVKSAIYELRDFLGRNPNYWKPSYSNIKSAKERSEWRKTSINSLR